MGETRVNLQHLLEDIRDTYPFPAEEAILTELVANALDSAASEIRFLVSSRDKTLTTVDNGRGMSPRNWSITTTSRRRRKCAAKVSVSPASAQNLRCC